MGRFSSKKTKEFQDIIDFYKENKSEIDCLQKDWKSPENRQELFNRYFKFRVLTHDLDHIHYMKYLTKDYDYEDKAWFAFAFGMTYRTPQAYAYTETFRNFHKWDLEYVEKWHAENWKRTTYGTDARYNKGHFFKQFKSVREWLNGKTFKEKLECICNSESSQENFTNLYNEVQSLYKFGRMTGWLTLQALHDLLGLNIDPNEILLEGYSPNNDSSLKSIWNGLCALTNKPEKMLGKYGNYVCTEEDVIWGRQKLKEYTEIAEEYSGFKIDSFRKESIWCQYKRLFNEDCSKEYAGHASGDAASRYLYYKEHWPEINWKQFREAIRMQPGMMKGLTFIDWFNQIFSETGIMVNMHQMFDDMPNFYEIFNFDVERYRIKDYWIDDGLTVPLKFNLKEDVLKGDKWVEVVDEERMLNITSSNMIHNFKKRSSEW